MNTKVIIPLLLLCISSNNCYADSKNLLTEGKVGEYYFKLLNETEHCRLTVTSAEKEVTNIALQSKSPCYFFTKVDQQEILSYFYPKDNIDKVILIGGSPIDPKASEMQMRKLPLNALCTQDIQAITIEAGEVKLTPRDNNAFACNEHRLDEKIYHQVTQQERVSLSVYLEEQEKSEQVVTDAQSVDKDARIEGTDKPTLIDRIKDFF